MLSSMNVQENWDQLRERIRQKWPQFSDADLGQFEGNVDELVARIQRKTGANRDSIHEFLQTASQEGSTMMNRMKEQVSGTMAGARDAVGNVAEQARHGYEQVQTRVGDTVHDHPGMTVAAAFGLGVIAGIGLSLLLFDDEPEPMSRRYARDARNLGQRFWESIAENMPDAISRRM
jgi:ElaB/YqjD/DUF883 family membrane-anchored ribosome-binding protein